MIVALTLLFGTTWFIVKRRRDRFLRSYSVYFLILLFFVINKGSLATSAFFSSDNNSPLSLLRWLALFWCAVVGIRMRRPPSFKLDTLFFALLSLFLLDILFSTSYAEDRSYSLMRAVSFVLMALIIFRGCAYYLHFRVNCLEFFRLHYLAVISLFPVALLLHLSGFGAYGAAVVMNQYAGPVSNQNLFGILTALFVPYVLFHWQMEASSWLPKALDLLTLASMFVGLWLSNSRGGLLATSIAVLVYFFVINLESRLKLLAVGICILIGILALPRLQSAFHTFIRKDTIERAEIAGVAQQIYEERRYGMWAGVFPLYWKEKMTGYGFGTSHLLVYGFTTDKETGRHVHNSYLELFGDLGLPGIVLLLLLFARLAAYSFDLLRRDHHRLQRNISAVFLSVFAAGSVNAFFESWMFSVGNIVALLFWAPLAGIVAQWAWCIVATERQNSFGLATNKELKTVITSA